jgi:hypothetical protein
MWLGVGSQIFAVIDSASIDDFVLLQTLLSSVDSFSSSSLLFVAQAILSTARYIY